MKDQPTLLCIYYDNLVLSGSGVVKKIFGQMKAFERLGFTVQYVFHDGEKFVLCEGDKKTPLLYLKKHLFLSGIRLSFVLRKVFKNRRPDVCYVRYWTHLHLYGLFKGKSKLVVEIPTFEVQNEILGDNNRVLFIRLIGVALARFVRKFLLRRVDYFINFEGVTRFAGSSAFSMNNGIDVSSIPLKKDVCPDRIDDSINLIAVSSMAYWQGYERIIKSLGEYKRRLGTNARKIHILLVGDGSEIPYYHSLVEEYGLQDDVEFCGILSGKKLDEAFDRADVALGGLGLYKKGLYSASTLKVKEYCARGFPIVDASNDRAFTGKEEFVLSVPNDDSEIDMEDIVSFYDRVSSIPDLRQKIRAFCEDKFDWTKEFQRFFKTAFNWDLVPSDAQNINL